MIKKNSYQILLFVIILLITINLPVGALNLTARSIGMGGTFTGIADDINGIIYNPASITQTGSMGVNVDGGIRTSNWGGVKDFNNIIENLDDLEDQNINDLYEDLPENMDLGGQLFLGGNVSNFGFSLKRDKNLSTIDEDDSFYLEEISESILTYGSELLTPVADLGTIAYGFNLRFINRETNEYQFDFEGNDQLIRKEATGSGVGLDSGVLFQLTELVQAGIQVKDLYTPDYRINRVNYEYNSDQNRWEETGQELADKIRRTNPTLRAGTSLKIPVLNARIAADINNFSAVFTEKENMTYHLGAEKHLLLGALTLRGGYIDSPDNQFYTAGLGFNLLTLEVNTALAADSSLEEEQMFLLSGKMQF